MVYGDKTLALGIGGKKSGISRKHFLAWARNLGLTERAAEGVLGLALKASGPLIAELDAGASPLGQSQTRNWAKELRHRQRLMSG
ncbi:hypothetical protein GCM10027405_26630 [Arthrobacter alkaliphilus]|uniref:hypothetical protein n=1 Tax=Arthrobacter alkaliphilus TaxID=369936 RepID=UPI001F3871C5|nr:hypothetical protein [Arthrobacter alkaliphilus]